MTLLCDPSGLAQRRVLLSPWCALSALVCLLLSCVSLNKNFMSGKNWGTSRVFFLFGELNVSVTSWRIGSWERDFLGLPRKTR